MRLTWRKRSAAWSGLLVVVLVFLVVALFVVGKGDASPAVSISHCAVLRIEMCVRGSASNLYAIVAA